MSNPERSCGSDQCNAATSEKGSGLTIYLKGNGYQKRLIRPSSMRNAAIPIQLTEDSVELRDGSTEKPIRLPAIQKSNSISITALIIQTADGTIQSWNPSNFFGKKKLSLINGSLTLEDDYSSDIFVGTMCEGDCSDIDGIIGYKELTVSCPGQPDKKAIQLWKIPSCCSGEIPDP